MYNVIKYKFNVVEVDLSRSLEPNYFKLELTKSPQITSIVSEGLNISKASYSNCIGSPLSRVVRYISFKFLGKGVVFKGILRREFNISLRFSNHLRCSLRLNNTKRVKYENN